MTSQRIMIFETEENLRKPLIAALKEYGYPLIAPESAEKAIAVSTRTAFHALLVGPGVDPRLGIKVIDELMKASHNHTFPIHVMLKLPYPKEWVSASSSRQNLRFVTLPASLVTLAPLILASLKPQHHQLYSDQVLGAIRESIVEVIKYYMPAANNIEMHIKKNRSISGYAKAYIYLLGSGTIGSIQISLQKTIVMGTLFSMLGGDESALAEIDAEMISDVVTEICNQIAGTAKGKLVKLGINLDMSFPVFIAPETNLFYHPSASPVAIYEVGKYGTKMFGFMKDIQSLGTVEFSIEKYA